MSRNPLKDYRERLLPAIRRIGNSGMVIPDNDRSV